MGTIDKNLLVVLGNGFTIDMLENVFPEVEIDVRNLFHYGDKVRWLADNEPGFLSYKRCPNLWNLGVRPGMNITETNNIIEEIISCANIYAYGKKKSLINADSDNIYIKAYKELVTYLRFLFTYYNELIDKSEFGKKIKESNWGWKVFLQNIIDENIEYKKITFITYNYDIWLERILDCLDIKYNIAGLTNNQEALVDIIKPHGSISFQSQRTLDNFGFSISYNRDLIEGQLSNLKVDENNLIVNSTMNAMIPPAGDSSRFKSTWSNELQEIANSNAKVLIQNDDVIICGISYWHVDRLEIDELLLSLDRGVNLKVINPSMPRELSAVLSCLFSNYTAFTDSNVIGGQYE